MGAQQEESEARDTLRRLERAINDHDLEALVGCFRADFVSEQPAHPARNFRGPRAGQAQLDADLGRDTRPQGHTCPLSRRGRRGLGGVVLAGHSAGTVRRLTWPG